MPLIFSCIQDRCTVCALTLNKLASGREPAVPCVTEIPLKQVHWIIDTGLLGDCAKLRKGARVIFKDALVGLKLAFGTNEILTLEAGGGLCAMSLNILP